MQRWRYGKEVGVRAPREASIDVVGQAVDDGLGGKQSLAALRIVVSINNYGECCCGIVVCGQVSGGGECRRVEYVCDVLSGRGWRIGKEDVNVICIKSDCEGVSGDFLAYLRMQCCSVDSGTQNPRLHCDPP